MWCSPRLLPPLLAWLVVWAHPACAAPVWVGHFSAAPSATPGPVPTPWRVVRFNPRVAPTHYQIRLWDGVAAIEAHADASMALLVRPLELDLGATPVLCWRWRAERVVQGADITTKQGDDYAARVYVAFSVASDASEAMSLATRGQLALARTLYDEQVPDAVLNYVWDNHSPVGTRRANAYTDRNQMIVQRSGAERAGQWVTERVNVLADAIKSFGTDRLRAVSLAVATDTDNTGEQAHSGFADLHFVSTQEPCAFAATATARP